MTIHLTWAWIDQVGLCKGKTGITDILIIFYNRVRYYNRLGLSIPSHHTNQTCWGFIHRGFFFFFFTLGTLVPLVFLFFRFLSHPFTTCSRSPELGHSFYLFLFLAWLLMPIWLDHVGPVFVVLDPGRTHRCSVVRSSLEGLGYPSIRLLDWWSLCRCLSVLAFRRTKDY